MEVKVGDKLKFDSENGMTYDITVVNINDFRSPDETYAIDILYPDGTHWDEGDVFFVGQQFIDRCYKE